MLRVNGVSLGLLAAGVLLIGLAWVVGRQYPSLVVLAVVGYGCIVLSVVCAVLRASEDRFELPAIRFIWQWW